MTAAGRIEPESGKTMQAASTGAEWVDPLCEHVFVTSQGHAYSRFRRALDRHNVIEALSAAAELEHVGLTEALELVLLLHRKAPDRFGRAALRWHGRYCREIADVDLDEGQAVLAALSALRSKRGAAAARALSELLDRRGLERAGEVLVGWSRNAAL